MRQALDKVRPLFALSRGNVELLGLSGGVVRLRMLGSCDGCPSSAMTLKHAIEAAIYEKAPDVTGIEVDQPATNGHVAKDGQRGSCCQSSGSEANTRRGANDTSIRFVTG